MNSNIITGNERFYFKNILLNDENLKASFDNYIGTGSFETFAYALANNFYAQFANRPYEYEEPLISDLGTYLFNAIESGDPAEDVYASQLSQYNKYIAKETRSSWNLLVYHGEVTSLPSFVISLYRLGGVFYFYRNNTWNIANDLGEVAILPDDAESYSVCLMEDEYYFYYNSVWTKVSNIIEPDELPYSSYELCKISDTYKYLDDGVWTDAIFDGEVEELPNTNNNKYIYYLIPEDRYYLRFSEEVSRYPDVEEPKVFTPIQAALMVISNKTFNWYSLDYKNFYIEAFKAIRHSSIRHFFYENRDKYIPSYDLFLIDKNERRKVFVNTMLKEFDKFTDIIDTLKAFNDPDAIPDKFVIYFMEMLGYTVNDYSDTIDEAQVRSLIKNLMDVYRHKGSLFAFEVFFGCMGIECNVKELYFDRRLFYQPERNKYTRVETNTSFAYYLTPNNPTTTSYYYFSGDEVTKFDMIAPISSLEWTRLISQVDSGSTTDAVRTMLGYSNDFEFDSLPQPFTYFKTNYLLFNFTSPYNKMKYGSSQYEAKSDSVSKVEFEAYVEMMNHIIPVFIKQYYQNFFDTEAIETEVIEYGDSKKNPKDLFFIDSNIYNDEAIKRYLASLGKEYIYPEISNAALRHEDTRLTEFFNKFPRYESEVTSTLFYNPITNLFYANVDGGISIVNFLGKLEEAPEYNNYDIYRNTADSLYYVSIDGVWEEAELKSNQNNPSLYDIYKDGDNYLVYNGSAWVAGNYLGEYNNLSSITEGDFYYNITSEKYYIRSNNAWVENYLTVSFSGLEDFISGGVGFINGIANYSSAYGDVILKEGDGNVYSQDGEMIVGELLNGYFWKVNNEGSLQYSIPVGSVVMIVPELFLEETKDSKYRDNSYNTEFFAAGIDVKGEESTFGSEESVPLFEHSRWIEENHVGDAYETEVEFRYNSYSNPLKEIRAEISSQLEITLE